MKSSGSFPQLLITEREVKLPKATLFVGKSKNYAGGLLSKFALLIKDMLMKIKLPLLLSQAKQRSLGRPFATDTTAEEQQQEITR